MRWRQALRSHNLPHRVLAATAVPMGSAAAATLAVAAAALQTERAARAARAAAAAALPLEHVAVAARGAAAAACPASAASTGGSNHKRKKPNTLGGVRGFRACGTYDSSVAAPPAAVIFSRALPLNLCAVTLTLTVNLPSPSTLINEFLRTAPEATSSSTPTSPPLGNSLLMSPTLTTS